MSDFWDNQKEIKRITKNKSEEIVVSVCSRNNKDYLDVRIYKKAKDSDTYIPTSKGFNIEMSHAEEVSEALIEALKK